MKKTFVRIVDDEEINIDGQQDFCDKDGTRHPRNVLWHWDEEELWDILDIKVIWLDEESEILELDPIQIPKEPEPPLPVVPPDEPLPPTPPPHPPAPPQPPHPAIVAPEAPRASQMIQLVSDAGIEIDDRVIAQIQQLAHTDAVISTLVAFGGIAIRTLRIAKLGGFHQGHRHNYDHMTNLVHGSVLCEVDNTPPKRYDAPAQITIAADHWHKFTALTDDVIYQCVYRQPDREDLYTIENSPYNVAPFTPQELVEKLKTIDNPCAHCACDKE